jgi:hypothetical protein
MQATVLGSEADLKLCVINKKNLMGNALAEGGIYPRFLLKRLLSLSYEKGKTF